MGEVSSPTASMETHMQESDSHDDSANLLDCKAMPTYSLQQETSEHPLTILDNLQQNPAPAEVTPSTSYMVGDNFQAGEQEQNLPIDSSQQTMSLPDTSPMNKDINTDSFSVDVAKPHNTQAPREQQQYQTLQPCEMPVNAGSDSQGGNVDSSFVDLQNRQFMEDKAQHKSLIEVEYPLHHQDNGNINLPCVTIVSADQESSDVGDEAMIQEGMENDITDDGLARITAYLYDNPQLTQNPESDNPQLTQNPESADVTPSTFCMLGGNFPAGEVEQNLPIDSSQQTMSLPHTSPMNKDINTDSFGMEESCPDVGHEVEVVSGMEEVETPIDSQLDPQYNDSEISGMALEEEWPLRKRRHCMMDES